MLSSVYSLDYDRTYVEICASHDALFFHRHLQEEAFLETIGVTASTYDILEISAGYFSTKWIKWFHEWVAVFGNKYSVLIHI